jgi:ribosomal protein L32
MPYHLSRKVERSRREKKRYHILKLYRSNAFHQSTCPPCMHICPTASRCHVVPKTQESYSRRPLSALNSPWVSRSACPTAHAVRQVREATRRPSRAPGIPKRPFHPSSCCRRDPGRNARLQVWRRPLSATSFASRRRSLSVSNSSARV